MLCLYLTCGRGALQGLLLGELTSERAYMARQERLSPLYAFTEFSTVDRSKWSKLKVLSSEMDQAESRLIR
jgi:hypothetical protein